MTRILLAVFIATGLAAAQQKPKQPAPKSQKEMEAVMAIQTAATPDARIAAVETLLTSFADTEFKEFALQMETVSHQQKNDFDKTLIAGERTLAINPDNIAILVILAQTISQQTRELDLDKEEKLSKADQYARKAQKLIPNLEKFNPQITDEEWVSYKKAAMSQAQEALGIVAYVRKDYAGAEKAFQTAAEVAPQPDPTSLYRLAMARREMNKLDEALAALETAIAAGGVQAGGKELAAELKAEIQKLKAGGAKPAAPAAPPQVEIKRP